MPQDKKALAQELRQRAKAPPAPPAPAAPSEKPWSVSGFAENLYDDATETLKGLFNLLPTAAKAGYDILSDPEGLKMLMAQPEHLGSSLKDTAVAVKNAIIEPYQKHGAGVVYHRPVTTLLDALTILDLGASSLARAGKIAGATRVTKFAEALRAAPGKLASGGIDKLASKLGLDLPKMREFSALKRETLSRSNVQLAADYERVLSKVSTLDDASRALLDKYITTGGDLKTLGANPAVRDALESYGRLVGEWQEYLKAEGLLNDFRAERTVIKKYAAERKIPVKQAAAEIKALEVKPTYGHAMFERTGLPELDDLLKASGETKTGNVGFLEKYTGAEGRIKDPAQYIAKSIQQFRQTQQKLELVKRILRNPEWVQSAMKGEGEIGKLLPEGIFKRYWEQPARARGLKFEELKRAEGAVSPLDPRIQQATTVVADKAIRRLLTMEFNRVTGGIGSIIRVYDKVLSLFKQSATLLNPRWYTGNVIGDALLAELAGANWGMARQLLAKRGRFAALHGGGTIASELTGGFLERAAEIGGMADEAARAGIITREMAAEMKRLGVSFEASAEVLENVLRSSDDFQRLEGALVSLREMIARQSGDVLTMDRQIAALVERERAAAAKLSQAEAVTQSPREAQIAERVKALETQKQALLERLGIAKEGAAAARREIRQLVKHVPPDELRRAVKQAVARYNLQLADRELDALIAASKEQASLASGYKAAREQAKAQGARMAESVESRAKRIDAAREYVEGLRQQIVNLGTKREALLRDVMDDVMKSEKWEARIPGLKQQNDIVRAGVNRANAFTGDYLGMNGFEQGVIRRIIPFYAWSKAMTMLAFRLPFLAPVKTFLWQRYAMAMMSMVGDSELPEYMAGYVPVFARENGDMVWLKLGSFNPASGLRRSTFGNMPVPSNLNPVEANPFISLVVRMAGGKTVFDRATVPYGEKLVRIDSGDVYEFTEDGTLRKTIAQTPLISGVVHMFPIAQFIEDLLTPYQATEHNWVGLPVPALKPDGSHRYPREWWQRLAGLAGVPLQSRKREDIIRMERARVRRAILSLKGAYRRADPEEQEFIRGAMQDYARGEYRRIEG